MIKHLLSLILLVSVVGCSYSYNAIYSGNAVTEKNKPDKPYVVAVELFEDQRNWVKSPDSKSASIIADMGSFKYGVSYEGQKYESTANIVKDIFLLELNRAGYQAKDAGELANFDYKLSGKIDSFYISRQQIGHTYTERRQVSLTLNLEDGAGNAVFTDKPVGFLFDGAVSPATNPEISVDQLINVVLRKVVYDALLEIRKSLPVDSGESVE